MPLRSGCKVEKKGMVFDVIQVILELFGGVFDRCPILITYLGPPRHAWLDTLTNCEIGYLLGQLIDKIGPLRTGPNQTHGAAQHTKELGQFVNTEFADHSPNLRHAIISG